MQGLVEYKNREPNALTFALTAAEKTDLNDKSVEYLSRHSIGEIRTKQGRPKF